MTDTVLANQLTLYYSPTCPFCQRVLNAMKELGLNPDLSTGKACEITLKNIAQNSDFKNELISGGGKKTVPCISINRNGQVEWMYESLDIISFLKAHLA